MESWNSHVPEPTVCACGQGHPSWGAAAEQCQQLREVILPLSSALLRPHLGYFVQLQVPQGMELLEQVQQGISKVNYEEKLRGLGVFSQDKTSSQALSVCRELRESFVFGGAKYDQRRLRLDASFLFFNFTNLHLK